MNEALRTWLQQEALRWSFILKTFLAALLALFVSFRLQLALPSTALVTVFIVAQPQSGLVIAKGFYRILGTTVGSLVTVVLIALFAQNQLLFLSSLCLWVGFCVAGAAWFRDFQAYAFMLAGYTACLIGFPAVLQPQTTFHLAVDRVSEIYVGILCTAVVGDVLWPQRLGPQLVQQLRRQYRELLSFLQQAVSHPLDHSISDHDPINFVIRILELESLRASAIFEDPQSRLRSDRLRLFSADFMRLTTTLHALQQMGRRMRKLGMQASLTALRPLVESLGRELSIQGHIPETAAQARPLLRQLDSFRPWLQQRIDDSRNKLKTQVAIEQLQAYDGASELLLQMVNELYDLTATYASLPDRRHRPQRRAPDMAFFTPLSEALTAGLRAVLALLTLNMFWIYTAWPQGALAASIACVACALFAMVPQPQQAVRQMAGGFALGLVGSFILNLLVLPKMDGFALLAMALLPFIAFGLWLATRPSTFGVGIAFCLMLANALPLHNTMRFDGIALLNNGLAQLLGVSIAGIAFSLLQRGQLKQQRRYYRQHLARQLAQTCHTPLKFLPHRFDGRTRDLMRQVLTRSPRLVDELLPCALSVLELGDAIVEWRLEDTQALPAVLRRQQQQALRQLESALRRPQANSRQQALVQLRELENVLDQHFLQHPDNSGLRRLLHALRRLQATLADEHWFATFAALEEPSTLAQGAAHAT